MNENNQRFIKLFWSYATMIILPVLLSGILTLGLLFKELAVDTKSMRETAVQQTVDVLDSEMGKVQSLLLEIEQSDKVVNFINENLTSDEVDKYNSYSTTLELISIKESSSFCRKAGFYIEDKDIVVTNSSTENLEAFYKSNFDSTDFSLEALKEKFHKRDAISDFFVCNDGDGQGMVVFYKTLPVAGRRDCATVFAVCSNQHIISQLGMEWAEKDIEFAMSDDEGNLVLKSDNFDVANNNVTDASGNVVVKKSQKINCRYVFQLPKGGVVGRAGNITLVFVIVIFLTVLLCIILTYYQVRKMKKLFLGIFDEKKGLESNLSEQLENAKERILSNVLHNIRTDVVATASTMTKYGINLTKKYFAVMTVSDTQFNDSEVYSSAAESAWDELNRIIGDRIKEFGIIYEIVRTGSNVYSYILNFDTPGTSFSIRSLPGEIFSKYSVSTNIGMGRETDYIEKLYSSYEESVSALRYGLNSYPGEAVFYQDIHDLEISKIYYTGEKEKQLIRSIKIGSQSDVNEIMDEVYNVNFKERHISHSSFRKLIFNISLTVYKVLDDAYEGDTEKHDKYGRVCQNLFNNDNSEECFAILREICLSLCADIGNKSNDDIIKAQIVDYIENHYDNPNLSLEVLAEHMDISYHYLSRLFKEYLGTNFVSYLTLVRLEKAKDLLQDPELTIGNIAEQTGFMSSNSLIRAFKKYYDTTPGKFRKI